MLRNEPCGALIVPRATGPTSMFARTSEIVRRLFLIPSWLPATAVVILSIGVLLLWLRSEEVAVAPMVAKTSEPSRAIELGEELDPNDAPNHPEESLREANFASRPAAKTPVAQPTPAMKTAARKKSKVLGELRADTTDERPTETGTVDNISSLVAMEEELPTDADSAGERGSISGRCPSEEYQRASPSEEYQRASPSEPRRHLDLPVTFRPSRRPSPKRPRSDQSLEVGKEVLAGVDGILAELGSGDSSGVETSYRRWVASRGSDDRAQRRLETTASTEAFAPGRARAPSGFEALLAGARRGARSSDPQVRRAALTLFFKLGGEADLSLATEALDGAARLRRRDRRGERSQPSPTPPRNTRRAAGVENPSRSRESGGQRGTDGSLAISLL